MNPLAPEPEDREWLHTMAEATDAAPAAALGRVVEACTAVISSLRAIPQGPSPRERERLEGELGKLQEVLQQTKAKYARAGFPNAMDTRQALKNLKESVKMVEQEIANGHRRTDGPAADMEMYARGVPAKPSGEIVCLMSSAELYVILPSQAM